MQKVLFLGKECIGIKSLNKWVNQDLKIFTYTGTGMEYGRQQKNGKFKLFTEDQLAIEYLNSAKGVEYKGLVYFLKDNVEKSDHYNQFAKAYKQNEFKLNSKVKTEFLPYLNGALYEGLKDNSQFSKVKSMITLYETNVCDLDWLREKLKMYLKPESVAIVLYELHELAVKAG